MSSSEYAGFIRDDLASLYGTDQPVDTGMVRDTLVNNVQHAHDQRFQTKANWLTHDTSLYLAPVTPSDLFPVFVCSIGPFPVTVGADGKSGVFVGRLYGLANTSSESCTWYVQIVPAFYSLVGASTEPVLYQAAATSSDSADWSNWDSAIQMTPFDLLNSQFEYDTEVALGGAVVRGSVALARIDVYVQSAPGNEADPRLMGWYVREYVGT